jgi:hypothetical protein
MEKYSAPKKRRVARSGVSDPKSFDLKDSTKREFVIGDFELNACRVSNSLEFSLVTFFLSRERKKQVTSRRTSPHKYCDGPSI